MTAAKAQKICNRSHLMETTAFSGRSDHRNRIDHHHCSENSHIKFCSQLIAAKVAIAQKRDQRSYMCRERDLYDRCTKLIRQLQLFNSQINSYSYRNKVFSTGIKTMKHDFTYNFFCIYLRSVRDAIKT